MRISLMVKTKRMDKLEYIPGDLVMVKKSALQFAKDKIFKVISSLSGGFVKVVMLNDSSTTYSISNNAVRPIPITPEILEKNGWRTQNSWYYYLDVAEGFISYIGIDFKHKSNEGHLYVEVDGNNMVEIQYCHELQHFLFGLGIKHEMEV